LCVEGKEHKDGRYRKKTMSEEEAKGKKGMPIRTEGRKEGRKERRKVQKEGWEGSTIFGPRGSRLSPRGTLS
jgi:hypothetical protein